ncbi:MAG TPA: long-chain fatty acid--CoA ligase [Candidatus Limnocylindrales bacterium]|nr:long-chain fatty acid--CoA ligase [Candidatus Limnocylindrales bacterium]
MTMQRTPLLLSRLMDRGPHLNPHEEIVTRTMAGGLHRQTYQALKARASQVANALRAAGIHQGDRVASFQWNNHRHLELYYAVPSMGAVLHTLNIRLSQRDLEYIINHAADRVIFVDEDLLKLVEPLATKAPTVEQWVVCSDSPSGTWKTSLPGTVGYEEWIASQPATYEWPEIDEHSPMGLCYTSGTTGNPKGVMYTHRSTYLHTMAQAMTDSLGLSATDCVLPIVPMFHAMSWGLPFTATMLGCKNVLPNCHMDAKDILDLMAAEQVSVSAGVPTIWQGLRAAIEAEPGRWELSHLSRVTCGGSAPPVSLMRWYWDKLGVEMIQGWGMTETNPLGTISRKVAKRSQRQLSLDEQFANAAKAGLTLPGLEIEIVDEHFQPLPHDGETVGELLIRGPWIASEYYANPQPEKFHDGWLVTGDVAKIDAEQYLIIADRSKDLIKSGGEWISSVDIENDIVAVPGVAQAAVVAQPHPKWDERPVALVVLAPDAIVTAADVTKHLAKTFAKWQLPDEILFVASLPLTSTGKLDKKVIRADLQEKGYRLPDLRSALQ